MPHDIDVKIHQPFARYTWNYRTHAVCGMASRAGEAILRHVIAVVGEARITHDVGQIMALGAHAIRSVDAEIGLRIQVDSDQRTWTSGRLAVFIIVFQQVPPLRAMRSIRS